MNKVRVDLAKVGGIELSKSDIESIIQKKNKILYKINKLKGKIWNCHKCLKSGLKKQYDIECDKLEKEWQSIMDREQKIQKHNLKLLNGSLFIDDEWGRVLIKNTNTNTNIETIKDQFNNLKIGIGLHKYMCKKHIKISNKLFIMMQEVADYERIIYNTGKQYG